MPNDIMPQFIAHVFGTYGPAALPIIVLYFVVRYLLDKDKERETNSKLELAAERELTKAERKRADDLQAELLKEARGNASLAEELKAALQLIAKGV